MPTSNTLLTDAFDRIKEAVHAVLDKTTDEQLTARLGPEANTIAWLIWHLTRVQDKHVADAAGAKQVWMSDGWFEQFGLPFDAEAHGYGQSSAEVAAVTGISTAQLGGYFDAVHAQTTAYIAGLSETEFDRIVDTRWDPPVTLAARLVSVISDDLQHVGQAAFIHGLLG